MITCQCFAVFIWPRKATDLGKRFEPVHTTDLETLFVLILENCKNRFLPQLPSGCF